MRKAVVIGSGVAGLSAAIRLAMQGWRVTVLEQAAEPGGKLREVQVGGYRFDAGPSLFTWPKLVMELDALVRAKHPDLPPFRYQQLDRSAHYFWPSGRNWVAWSDPEKRAASVDANWGAGMGARLERYLADSTTAFEATRPLFLESSLHERSTYSWRRLRHVAKDVFKLPLMGSFHGRNAGYGLDAELVQFLDRYATYNGSDPMRAPAMLQVIPHLEHAMGTYFPEGGMISITRHLHRLAESASVQFEFNTGAEEILLDGDRVQGVRAGGDRFPADLVVSNADIHPTYTRLLPHRPHPNAALARERSTSGLIFYWGVRRSFPALHLHNLFFSEEYAKEFEAIREQGDPAEDPTVYVHISSKLEPGDAPEGGENWFVLLNVAADPEHLTEARIAALKRATIRRVDSALREAGELSPSESVADFIEEEARLTPRDIEQRTSSWKGALYGTSSNSPAAAFLRHRNRSKDIQGLYFCGGSVHPGGGIPLCLLSGKIVSELVIENEPAP